LRPTRQLRSRAAVGLEVGIFLRTLGVERRVEGGWEGQTGLRYGV